MVRVAESQPGEVAEIDYARRRVLLNPLTDECKAIGRWLTYVLWNLLSRAFPQEIVHMRWGLAGADHNELLRSGGVPRCPPG
jgi:hypothetical protein